MDARPKMYMSLPVRGDSHDTIDAAMAAVGAALEVERATAGSARIVALVAYAPSHPGDGWSFVSGHGPLRVWRRPLTAEEAADLGRESRPAIVAEMVAMLQPAMVAASPRRLARAWVSAVEHRATMSRAEAAADPTDAFGRLNRGWTPEDAASHADAALLCYGHGDFGSAVEYAREAAWLLHADEAAEMVDRAGDGVYAWAAWAYACAREAYLEHAEKRLLAGRGLPAKVPAPPTSAAPRLEHYFDFIEHMDRAALA